MDVQVYSILNRLNTQKSKLFHLKAEEAFPISHDKKEPLQYTLSFRCFLNIQFFQGSGSQLGRFYPQGDTWQYLETLLLSRLGYWHLVPGGQGRC